MNKNYKLLIGIGALAALYFVFKKKGTTAKSTKTDESASKTDLGQPSSNGVGKELSRFQIDQLKKVAVKEGDSPKVIAIKTFQADLFINPPKSEAEAKARTAKYGITVADVDEYLGNPKSEFANFEDGVSSRAELRKQFGLSAEDDKKFALEKRRIKKSLEDKGMTKRELSIRLRKHLRSFAKKEGLNFEAFQEVEAAWKRERRERQENSSVRGGKKKAYQNYAGELESRIGDSRIKPTSVSGLSVAKRARNYGTAQRPTRPLMGKKRAQPIETSEKMSNSLDFDGNDDVQGSIM
jgi:hypothetical protein